MKKTSTCFLAFLLICSTLVSSASAVTVTPRRASLYISSYYADCTAMGSGKVCVAFDITATKSSMTNVGATSVKIYEKMGSTWSHVKTFYSSAYPSMLSSNTGFHGSTLTYNGVVGRSYYAVVCFYAGNSSGSDSRNFTTNTVIAR